MTDAVSASVTYLMAYAAMTIASWAVVMVVVRRLRPPDGVLLVADVRGLARTSPWLGGSLLFAFACLAGLPPGIVGLIVKVRVFQVAVTAQSWLLVAVAVAATVAALIYYLRVTAVLLAEAAAAVPVPVPAAVPDAAPALLPAGVQRGEADAGPPVAETEPAGASVAVVVSTAALVVTSVAPALLLGLL